MGFSFRNHSNIGYPIQISKFLMGIFHQRIILEPTCEHLLYWWLLTKAALSGCGCCAFTKPRRSSRLARTVLLGHPWPWRFHGLLLSPTKKTWNQNFSMFCRLLRTSIRRACTIFKSRACRYRCFDETPNMSHWDPLGSSSRGSWKMPRDSREICWSYMLIYIYIYLVAKNQSLTMASTICNLRIPKRECETYPTNRWV